MKAAPLIILIPCILVLAGLFWLDDAKEGTDPGADRPGSASASHEAPGQSGQDADPLVLHIVVGQAGSLENDIGNPVYTAPDETSEQIGTLQYNCCMLQADQREGQTPDGWVAVELSDPEDAEESVGFVRKQSVLTRTLTISDPDPIRMKIAKDAVSYLGLRFVRYGDSLTKGIDCSHFVQQIFAKSGVQIPESCNEMRDEGRPVPMHEVRTGDIIYYDVNEGYGHVGIYLGDGYLINSTGHAGRTYPEGGVRICALKYKDREEPAAYDLLEQE